MTGLLPNETYLHILGYLGPGPLSVFSLCCGNFHRLALPCLYRTLRIVLGREGPNNAALKLIRTFHENPERCYLLQNIFVSSPNQDRWIWEPLYRLFCSTLAALLIRLPPNTLRSFQWKLHESIDIELLSYVPRCVLRLQLENALPGRAAVFPTLEELSCSNICSNDTTRWVNWHLMNRKLRKLHLGFEPWSMNSSQSQALDVPSVPSAGFVNLTHLGLERADLSQWPFQSMTSLIYLNLQKCGQISQAFESILRACERNLTLKDFSISIVEESFDLETFLIRLSQRARLECLRVRTIGYCNQPTIACILRFKESIRHLELESRFLASDERTVHLYRIEDIAQITSHCLLLQHLSLPMDLHRANRKEWVRFLGVCFSNY